MNVEYGPDVFRNLNSPGNAASLPTGIDLKRMFLGVTYPHVIDERHSIGISPVLGLQTLKVKGLHPFQPFTAQPTKVTPAPRQRTQPEYPLPHAVPGRSVYRTD